MKKILVAIGGFSYAQRVLAEARQLAEALGSEVAIINVVDISREEHYIANKDFLEDIKKGAMAHSEEMLASAKLEFKNFTGEIETISKLGNAADEIINFAEIGGFDATYRAAGDDVDVCWRLQDKGYVIGFSAAMFVWHHRRCTVSVMR